MLTQQRTLYLPLPLIKETGLHVHLALCWYCKETHFMRKIRFLMTHNRCIFLHCLSCGACGLGLGANEVLDKKKKAQEWAKEKLPKCSHAHKLPVHVFCQNKWHRTIWLLVPVSVKMKYFFMYLCWKIQVRPLCEAVGLRLLCHLYDASSEFQTL